MKATDNSICADQPKRILLGQLASNGDCLYATTIARQIKADYPGCHLTWAIGPAYRSILRGNPDVDEVWEVDYYNSPGDFGQWARFEAEAKARQKHGDFDEIFLTQIAMPNFHLWTGGVRFAIYRAYARPITVDMAPVVRLSDEEIENVRRFAEIHQLAGKSQVVLFECAPRSAQSLVNPQFALEVATQIVKANVDVAVVLSSNLAFDSTHPNIIDGSVLSLRENAELTKYCSLLIGASSGVTWISTSDWAKPLPMIQLVVPDLMRSNSPTCDFLRRKQETKGIIETCSYSLADVIACVNMVLNDDFAGARAKFQQIPPLKFGLYNELQNSLIRHLKWKQAFQLLIANLGDYGWKFQFFLIPSAIFLRGFLATPRKLLSKTPFFRK